MNVSLNAGLAVEDDPYILHLPGPDSLVVLPQWISPGNVFPNSRYQDLVWSLAPLIDNPSTRLPTLNWVKCPEPFIDQLKPPTWAMINGQRRPTYLQTRGRRARARVSATEMIATCREWISLTRWLDERHIGSLADCGAQEWRAYLRKRVLDGLDRRTVERVASRLTNLWAFDQLSVRPIGVTQPPWETEGIDDFLPAADGAGGGENTTEPLDPQVLGPLLVWAIRMVDDFADDILAGWAETRKLTTRVANTSATTTGQVALEEFLRPVFTSNAALPSTCHMGKQTLATTYIAARTGASFTQVDRFNQAQGLSALATQRPGPCPLQVPVTGRLNGKLWREYIDFTEAADLMRHLGTAAAIICLYLTGMRPQEKRAELRSMQHSTSRAIRIAAGRKGCVRRRCRVINKSTGTACASAAPAQQCCI